MELPASLDRVRLLGTRVLAAGRRIMALAADFAVGVCEGGHGNTAHPLVLAVAALVLHELTRGLVEGGRSWLKGPHLDERLELGWERHGKGKQRALFWGEVDLGTGDTPLPTMMLRPPPQGIRALKKRIKVLKAYIDEELRSFERASSAESRLWSSAGIDLRNFDTTIPIQPCMYTIPTSYNFGGERRSQAPAPSSDLGRVRRNSRATFLTSSGGH
jgi:hypothetical protein